MVQDESEKSKRLEARLKSFEDSWTAKLEEVCLACLGPHLKQWTVHAASGLLASACSAAAFAPPAVPLSHMRSVISAQN